jgi:hypothetical protein
MFGAKKKILGGREYMVLGNTIEYSGRLIVRRKYTTTIGNVVIENGQCFHPNGDITKA